MLRYSSEIQKVLRFSAQMVLRSSWAKKKNTLGGRATQEKCLLLWASAHQKQLFLRPSSIRANDKVLTIANYIDPCERICGSCERNVSMRTALIFKLNIYSWVGHTPVRRLAPLPGRPWFFSGRCAAVFFPEAKCCVLPWYLTTVQPHPPHAYGMALFCRIPG